MAGSALANRKRRVPVPPAPPGRPTLYKPEYCAIAESLGKQGKSQAQIASTLNVDRESLRRWAAAHEEFAASLARAKTHEQAWWEEHGKKNLKSKHYQSQVWRTSMAARFKEDYTEGRADMANAFDLAAFVGTLAGSAARQMAQPAPAPGDDAKAIEPQDVVTSEPKG